MQCRRRTIGRRMPMTVMATLIGDRHTRREREGLIDVAGSIWKWTETHAVCARCSRRGEGPDRHEVPYRARLAYALKRSRRIAAGHRRRARKNRDCSAACRPSERTPQTKSVMQARVATLETKQFQAFSLSDCNLSFFSVPSIFNQCR
jgi:hypothetical protein